ncbi:hypothetical protein [Streptomyces sp. SID14478]|uniref:hypothetical protein n=1 Tax=Streptomyces sp. SID14478 TaxID=2706073 RepID=UPI00194555CC|nr:hypothetical protein [Streptomyces sp. SID14478]
MTRTVRHPEAPTGPADLGLALTVAATLHPPVTRAPEVTSSTARPRAARGRRATVRG